MNKSIFVFFGMISVFGMNNLVLSSDDRKNWNKTNTISLEEKSKWIYTEKINPIDDTVSNYLYLYSDVRSKYGEKIYIIIRCHENKTDLITRFEQFLNNDDIVLTTRIGKNKAENRNWNISTDYKAVFHKKPISFIKNMFGEEKLVIKVTPYSENTTIVDFDIKGIEKEIEPIRKNCNW
jgi:hypothetical protein